MLLTLIEKRSETSDVYTFIFQPDQPITWQAGQYMRYTLPHPNPDTRDIKRYFTIASAPFQQNPQITTRLDLKHGSSFKKALFNLRVGQTIEAAEPKGSFTLADPSQPSVFIAGGIGITPFHSILLDLDHRQQPLNITLLYANRNQEIVFKKLFDELAQKHSEFKVQYFISPEKLDESALQPLAMDHKLPTFFVSGPEPMVESLSETLIKLGVSEDRLKQDFFPGYAD